MRKGYTAVRRKRERERERERDREREREREDVWNFTPVSYRTSALWGRCPKSI